jgi:nucleoside-diphosphate-sugar epimerase
MKGLRVLVTGGAGMLGSTIARLAVQSGAVVTVVDTKLSLQGDIVFNLRDVWDKITVMECDIRDQVGIKAAVTGKDLIFNLAAQVSYGDSNIDPFLDLDINCRGLLNVLEACRNFAPNAKLLFSSTRFVYGKIEYSPVDEKHPFNCLSIYGINKLAGEKYHRFYFDAYGLNSCSLRIANPYGPRQQMEHNKFGIVNWFIRQALEGKPLTIYGEGAQRRDYLYIDDLAEAFICAALSNKTSGEVYNVGSGRGVPFIEMAHTIAKLVPGTIVQEVEWPKDRYFVETGDYISDISKLCRDTGWKPRMEFRTGIAETIRYYRENAAAYWQIK